MYYRNLTANFRLFKSKTVLDNDIANGDCDVRVCMYVPLQNNPYSSALGEGLQIDTANKFISPLEISYRKFFKDYIKC